MAKKTDKKLALKRETLRSLTNDQLQAVAGGTLNQTDYQAGGLKGTTVPPPPSGETLSIIKIYNYNYYP